MLKFEIIGEENKCKKLWSKFSPNKILWDIWDFRYCFHNKNFDFYFIAGFKNNKEMGLISLVYEKKNKIYTYFGDTFPEQNNFFLTDKNKLPLFLKQFPEDTQIFYIDKSEKEFYNFDLEEKRYFLNLKKYHDDIENYLKIFSKKHRKNLRYDLKKLKERNFKIKINSTGHIYLILSAS